ncbi:hypothetical protein AVEN_14319-1 [Araneus ventricosus]|uniref:Uncharacterized protein n=1 Tax=Araneus ventricosus TaxID=182803 RepID=A0A4Y2U491_ARAVE|nr:hypothetical protein AVEN_14319-1 [Araneus ventricosus]
MANNEEENRRYRRMKHTARAGHQRSIRDTYAEYTRYTKDTAAAKQRRWRARKTTATRRCRRQIYVNAINATANPTNHTSRHASIDDPLSSNRYAHMPIARRHRAPRRYYSAQPHVSRTKTSRKHHKPSATATHAAQRHATTYI